MTVADWIEVNAVPAAFTNQPATVEFNMPDEVLPLHAGEAHQDYNCATCNTVRTVGTGFRVMKTNVTIKLDADLLREVRFLAAEEGRSLSALLAEQLYAMVRERKASDKVQRRAFARLRRGLDLRWTPPELRDELYER